MPRQRDRDPWGQPATIERRGSCLHYWVVGQESAPLVALTHGATMDHRMFDLLLEALTDAGYRVLTWDVRGHGLSKPIGAEFSLPVVVEDLRSILDHHGADEVALVGQSLGGYVAQEFAFRHPERVDALAVVSATDVTTIPPRLEYAALKLSPYLFRIWPYEHLRRTIADRTAQDPAAKQYAYEATGQLSKREFLTVWRGVADALHDEPGYRVEVPMLLTHGENDWTGTVARDAPSWAEREPNCRYVVIPDAAHNANQDNPTFFNRVLIEFLGEHVPVD